MKKIYFFSLLFVLSPTLVFAEEEERKLLVTLHTPGGLITERPGGAPGRAYVVRYRAGGAHPILPESSNPERYPYEDFHRYTSKTQGRTIHYYKIEIHTQRDALTTYYQILLVNKGQRCLFEDESHTKAVTAGVAFRVKFLQSRDILPDQSRFEIKNLSAGVPPLLKNSSRERPLLSFKNAYQPTTICLVQRRVVNDNVIHEEYLLHIRFGPIKNNSLLPITFIPISRFLVHMGAGVTVFLPTKNVVL